MLLKLPLDVLIDITSYLPLDDKFQLVLTCKQLRDAILERYLYKTVDLLTVKATMQTALLKFRKNRCYGHQVKQLIIVSSELSNQLFSEIPLIFPNIVSYYDYSGDEPRPEDADSEFIKWKDQLEEFGDNRSHIYRLLENNVFSRLSYLDLSCLRENGNRVDFLEHIKNAPSLKHLTTHLYSITLEDMESIHSSCPMLSTFNIINCVLLASRDESLPETIVPASRLSCFIVKPSSFCDQQCAFLHYITKKYTNLIKFEFVPSFSEDGLSPLFQSFTHEEMISNPGFTTRRNEQRLTEEAYSASASKILANLPSTLKTMQFSIPNILDPVSIFSKKCINLTKLDFITNFSACANVFTTHADINIFKKLSGLKYLSVMLDPSIQKYKEGPISTNVTTLETIIKKGASSLDDMDIGWILSMFPSLIDLNIKCAGTRLTGYENDPLKTYPHLKRLTIGPSESEDSLMTFIRDAAPNLKHLYWTIFDRFIKEEMESSTSNLSTVIGPNKPKMIGELPNYIIDLTGLALDCFHLEVDFRTNYSDKKGDVVLRVRNRFGQSTEFVITKDFGRVHTLGYDAFSMEEEVNAFITVQYDYTKMITINSETSIDLENKEVKMKFWGLK